MTGPTGSTLTRLEGGLSGWRHDAGVLAGLPAPVTEGLPRPLPDDTAARDATIEALRR